MTPLGMLFEGLVRDVVRSANKIHAGHMIYAV
jgi:hypothetical protein